ncbi:MAG: trypsin-like peptidase domain-containing protein [bacterium]
MNLKRYTRPILVIILLASFSLSFGASPKMSLANIYNLCKEVVPNLVTWKDTGSPVVNAVSGSCVIIDEGGYALSNSHVVQHDGKHGAFFLNGDKYPFRIMGFNDAIDVSLVKIAAPKPLTAAKVGSSSKVAIGDALLACGYPGQRQFTVTLGTITSLTDGWGTEWGRGGSYRTDYLKTDAAINPGNSGGPAFNANGEVIGIVSGSQIGTLLNYAIPIDAIIKVLPDLIDRQGPEGYKLGIKVAPLGTPKVLEVTQGSPAQAAGLKVGDVVKSVDGKDVKVGLDYYWALIDKHSGETLKLTVSRKSETKEISLILESVEFRPTENITNPQNKLVMKFAKGEWVNVPDFSSLPTVFKSQIKSIELVEPFSKLNAFALEFTGYIKVPTDGVYEFYLASDDGSKLYIGDKLVVDNDGLHGTVGQKGYIALKAGFHPIKVGYFDRGGGKQLKVYYQGPGIDSQIIPESAFYH